MTYLDFCIDIKSQVLKTFNNYMSKNVREAKRKNKNILSEISHFCRQLKSVIEII